MIACWHCNMSCHTRALQTMPGFQAFPNQDKLLEGMLTEKPELIVDNERSIELHSFVHLPLYQLVFCGQHRLFWRIQCEHRGGWHFHPEHMESVATSAKSASINTHFCLIWFLKCCDKTWAFQQLDTTGLSLHSQEITSPLLLNTYQNCGLWFATLICQT